MVTHPGPQRPLSHHATHAHHSPAAERRVRWRAVRTERPNPHRRRAPAHYICTDAVHPLSVTGRPARRNHDGVVPSVRGRVQPSPAPARRATRATLDLMDDPADKLTLVTRRELARPGCAGPSPTSSATRSPSYTAFRRRQRVGHAGRPGPQPAPVMHEVLRERAAVGVKRNHMAIVESLEMYGDRSTGHLPGMAGMAGRAAPHVRRRHQGPARVCNFRSGG